MKIWSKNIEKQKRYEWLKFFCISLYMLYIIMYRVIFISAVLHHHFEKRRKDYWNISLQPQIRHLYSCIWKKLSPRNRWRFIFSLNKSVSKNKHFHCFCSMIFLSRWKKLFKSDLMWFWCIIVDSKVNGDHFLFYKVLIYFLV